jgi:hypothetical protein
MTNSAERMRITNSGNVGIGTASPNARLAVNGAAVNFSIENVGSGATINFANSNLAVTSSTGSSFTLNGLVSGGAYTLVITGNATTTVNFSGSGMTFRYMGTSARRANKHHIYSIICIGNDAYISMALEN